MTDYEKLLEALEYYSGLTVSDPHPAIEALPLARQLTEEHKRLRENFDCAECMQPEVDALQTRLSAAEERAKEWEHRCAEAWNRLAEREGVEGDYTRAVDRAVKEEGVTNGES